MSGGYVPSPAGFWKRYVAYFIDFLLVYVLIEALSAIYFSGAGADELAQAKDLLSALFLAQGPVRDPQALVAPMADLLRSTAWFSTLAYLLVAGSYFILSEASAAQATVGKRLLGIKVTDRDGRRIGVGRSAARFLAAALSWLTLNLGHALAAWTPERRALHDFLAGTRVENVDPTQPQMPFWAWVVVGAHALIFVLFTLAIGVAAWWALQSLAGFGA